jgi:hypothetical protein
MRWAAKLGATTRDHTLVTFIIHAFVSSVKQDRVQVIERLLAEAQRHVKIEIMTAGEVAKRVRVGAFADS